MTKSPTARRKANAPVVTPRETLKFHKPRHARPAKPDTVDSTRPKPALGKLGAMVHLMSRDQGAALHELCDATGWQAHSVRGALAGSLKRQRGYVIASEKTDGVRRYRIAAQAVAEASA